MTFRERHLLTEAQDNKGSVGSTLATGAIAGSIGYGLGTGTLQKGFDKVVNQSPKETGEDIKTGAESLFKKASDFFSKDKDVADTTKIDDVQTADLLKISGNAIHNLVNLV
jgi:hypothetical protein